MEKLLDYSKFELKPKEEITELLNSSEKIFVFGCRKCYQEFKEIEIPECKELLEIIKESGKTIIGGEELDFLCNIQLNDKIIRQKKDGADSIAVVSCGIGVQTVAGIVDLPVYPMANSISQGGYHGISLYPVRSPSPEATAPPWAGASNGVYEEKCQGCGQCYLNITGGICPITNCSKGLLNGPCGGAKDGKCEVDSEKECAWEMIYKRMKELKVIDSFKNEEIQMRDYSKPDFKTLNSYLLNIQEKRAEGFYGGLYPQDMKEETKDKPINQIPEPEIVIIPLSQHTGTICEPLIKVGESVKLGQKIGESKAFVSSPIHSSVSGKVIAIEPRPHPLSQENIPSVVVESDGKDEIHPSIKPYDAKSLSRDEIIDIIREKGIVGLGGAQFPTSVKLKPPKKVDTFILNGCECEPYLSGDYRVMLERTEYMILGMKLIMRALGVNKAYITIEDNKKDAINLVRNFLVSDESFKVVELRTKYPQGAERMLIKRVVDRDVPKGGLPFDVGVIVNNVSTVACIGEMIRTGMPLVKRVITVAGEIKEGGNFEVKIGTPFKDIIDYCGGFLDGDLIIKMGGPMMGITQDVKKLNEISVIKGTTGIVALKKPDIEYDTLRSCIKCGRCVDSCPMELFPCYFAYYGKDEKHLELEKYGVLDCIECGCCEYICSSKIPLINIIKKAKSLILKK